MPFKHQTESYRQGGKWICWCDGLDSSPQITAAIRAEGFKAKREGERVFILKADYERMTQDAAERISRVSEEGQSA